MATLNTNYTLLLNNYMGNFGGVDAYLRVYAKIERQDLVNNKSYVNIKQAIYASANYIYTGDNTYYLNSNIGSTGTRSGSFTFYAGETVVNTINAWANHNNDGTFTLSGSAGFTSQAWGKGSSGNYSATLPTIPRGSKINDFSGSSFNLGDPLTFSITKNVASYYDVLQIGFIKDNTTEYVVLDTVENVENGYVWNPTESILNTIYTNTPTQNSRTLTFKLSTYTDSTKATQIGDTNEKSNVGMIVNANPIFTSFNYEDANSNTIALTGNSSKIINGYSTLRISNLAATGNKGATLQLIQINDIQYPYSENFTIDIEKWTSNKITIYVIDSRNNSTKLETLIGINFINYTEKTITERSCLREGSINEESILSFKGTFFNSSFGAVANTLTASYKYKETGSNAWISGITALNLTINNNNFSFEGYIKGDTNTGFSADKSFDIQIIITDVLSERAITFILTAGEPAIDVFKSNVAFGGIYNEDESEYQAQFKKAVNFYGGIYKNGVEIGGESLPIGSMIPFGSQENIPSNWKICDGSAISRETYAELFDVIGTSYGEGDGSTTFNLPDKRGRVSVGLDSNQTEFDTIGKKSGSKYLQKHKHGLGSEGAWYYGVSTANLGGTGTWAYRAYETNEAGEGDSGNLQPYEIDIWIIKVSNLVSSLEETTGTIINNLTSTSATDALSANMGKELNEKHNWKLYTTTKGTATTNLPTNYNELYIEISKGDTDPTLSIYVPKASLTSSNRTFRTGYYFNSSVHGAVASVITLTTYRTADLYVSGAVHNSNALAKIYYR